VQKPAKILEPDALGQGLGRARREQLRGRGERASGGRPAICIHVHSMRALRRSANTSLGWVPCVRSMWHEGRREKEASGGKARDHSLTYEHRPA